MFASTKIHNGAMGFVRGDSFSCPLSFTSKRQACVSHSTLEAEIVAMDYTIRNLVLPGLALIEDILGKVKLRIIGDNSAAIRVMRTGRNPTMRHLPRTHRVAVAWLHEQYCNEDLEVSQIPTAGMAARSGWTAGH